MVNDKEIKIKLLMNYELCKLYINSCASTREISSVTGVSVATVKRALNSLVEKKEEYLRLLPEVFTEEKIEELYSKVKEVSQYNTKTTKWSDKEISIVTFGDDIEKIKSYKKEIDNQAKKVTENDRFTISNLRIMGYSYRKIKEETGFSISTISSVLTKNEDNKKHGI